MEVEGITGEVEYKSVEVEGITDEMIEDSGGHTGGVSMSAQ